LALKKEYSIPVARMYGSSLQSAFLTDQCKKIIITLPKIFTVSEDHPKI